jgi:DNA-3-methyladenine glycosylase I
MSYCDLAPGHPVHAPYHDTEYGFPSRDERILFERLVLEINQAGLSWLTILNKRPAFTKAYAAWDVDAVAAFGPKDVDRLLADAGIIRNRLKIDAAIRNAREIQKIRKEHGSFAAWIEAAHPRSKADWVKHFKSRFSFMGGEIVGEFLMSLGWLPGAHEEKCPVYQRIMALSPPWAGTTKKARRT